ncbi:MAG: hypothetical protein DRP91_08510 [Candidatus Neomarinimicrobiota bacterium]|nr:DUF4040 domain-containing protein [Candidatus Neomarinimicrobiota bacterium]RKY46859.1 MAG: hypothetical protein DRP91_08510 [Candidatus Neomarinimicrobiota bacterium]RKY48085.1 MAG: hypothetical protein DRP88_03035 [Candidatus Neomarinimicrobiota bacterium]RKY51861.1 MAG: hypothetical protein DRP92_06640 [Candidatus Neomarinimicrobiota bacterium]
MPVETWLLFILSYMIVGSIVALELKNILASIVSIGIVGLGVSISFLFLQAPDLAIVQFLFEIFALIILVRAFAKREYHEEKAARVSGVMYFITVIVLVAVLVVSIPVFRALPPFGDPIMWVANYYLKNGAAETGSANLVTSVILDYRAYDTLGEVTVLFTAILGALTILKVRSKKEEREEDEDE